IYVVGRDDDESIAAGSEVSDDAASWETVNDDEMDALENAQEDLEPLKASVSEAEEGMENNSGRNKALSLPLAAFDFVTRLASGFFSGRRKNDQIGLDSEGENEYELQGRDSSYESSSQKSNVDNSGGKNVSGKGLEHVEVEAQKQSLPLEDLSNLRIENLDPKTGDEDNACSFKRFDTAKDPLDHYFLGASGQCYWNWTRPGTVRYIGPEKGVELLLNWKPKTGGLTGLTTGPNNAGRKWLKKVQQDWNILQNNLPGKGCVVSEYLKGFLSLAVSTFVLSTYNYLTDGIYVRVYEDRMDLLRAVIVGAYGTPYQDGLFFFDFHLPPEYPDVPPSAYYHSGGWRLNPNLYEEGKVCLSLLNTWTGKGNEVWDPSSSSILQVLVSLQGLVLNAKPYFNEAGYDKQVGTAEGEKNSLAYNENTFLLNCKSMMYLMRKPPKDFEQLIKEHFRQRGYYILKACDAYMKGYLIGSLTKDASISDTNNADSNSVGFKLMLGKIVPKLLSALNEIGADCQEFKHLQQ
ncbi:hypothetical protein Gohar_020912, partial [Gossypium harknessii]|nr:hypothetical protein [Gossypium harknessii]